MRSCDTASSRSPSGSSWTSAFSSGAFWTPASPVADRDLLRRKLAELAAYVTQVSEYRDLTVERYRADWKTQRIVERTLQMAVEAYLDVASHVLSDRGLRAPTTYAEIFEVLVQAGLMSADLGRVMIEMTGF